MARSQYLTDWDCCLWKMMRSSWAVKHRLQNSSSCFGHVWEAETETSLPAPLPVCLSTHLKWSLSHRRTKAGDQVQPLSSPIHLYECVFRSCMSLPSLYHFFHYAVYWPQLGAFIERFLWLVCDGTGACLELRWVLVYPLLNQWWWRDRSKDSETDGQRQLEFVPLDGLLKVWHATLRAAQDLSAFCYSSWQLTQVGSSSLHSHISSCTKMLVQRWTLFSSSPYFFGFISSKTADELTPEVLMC